MKRASAIVTIALVAALLAGCGTMGRTPEKLISQVKGMNDRDAIQKYEVNRSFAQVSATLRERADQCLAVSVTTSYRDGYAVRTDTTKYTPRVVSNRNRTRLTLQQGWGPEVHVVGEDKPEPDGWYIMVVDVYPEGPQKTRVEGYSGRGDTVAFKAVRHWIEGSNLGCPDMTR